MKLIHTAAPLLSESTINNYFSHAGKDFMWETVAMIDNALTAICGNRIGQPLSDHPCPASTSEIQEQAAAWDAERADYLSQIAQLERHNSERDQLYISQMAEQRGVFAQQIDHLQTALTKTEQQSADYLKRIDAKNEQLQTLIVNRESTKRRTSTVITILAACLFIVTLPLIAYIVWDLIHIGAGFLR